MTRTRQAQAFATIAAVCWLATPALPDPWWIFTLAAGIALTWLFAKSALEALDEICTADVWDGN